jgi:hypothetical protein
VDAHGVESFDPGLHQPATFVEVPVESLHLAARDRDQRFEVGSVVGLDCVELCGDRCGIFRSVQDRGDVHRERSCAQPFIPCLAGVSSRQERLLAGFRGLCCGLRFGPV